MREDIFERRLERRSRRHSQWRLWLCAVLALANFLLWYVVIHENHHGLLTVAFLDVGEGAAVYVQAPNGNQALIDAGPDATVVRALGQIVPFYDRSLDVVVVSNTSAGRTGGLASVLHTYHVGEMVMATGTVISVQNAKEDIEEIGVVRGTRITLAPQVFLDVIFPDRDLSSLPAGDRDEDSLVLRLVYASTSVMLASDAPPNIQEYLAALDGHALKSDILAIPHEGAATSTSPDFVRAVSPSYAVISAAAGNRYGYPRQETLDILNAAGITSSQIFSTLGKGSIIFQSDGKSWKEHRL